MPFGSLWLPVVVSAVAVWIVSAIVHMVLRYHRADIKGLPDEESVAAALRKDAPAPGIYFIPHCADFSQLKDPAVHSQTSTLAVLSALRARTLLLDSGAPSRTHFDGKGLRSVPKSTSAAVSITISVFNGLSGRPQLQEEFGLALR